MTGEQVDYVNHYQRQRDIAYAKKKISEAKRYQKNKVVIRERQRIYKRRKREELKAEKAKALSGGKANDKAIGKTVRAVEPFPKPPPYAKRGRPRRNTDELLGWSFLANGKPERKYGDRTKALEALLAEYRAKPIWKPKEKSLIRSQA